VVNRNEIKVEGNILTRHHGATVTEAAATETERGIYSAVVGVGRNREAAE
jgi:hypothetical protein